ncbi:MAG TPA: DUF4271 domain-containing protein [Ferruginibacter sp.]|nr:DUF4271 domain-containing protein [Ferruginibacter sp.]
MDTIQHSADSSLMQLHRDTTIISDTLYNTNTGTDSTSLKMAADSNHVPVLNPPHKKDTIKKSDLLPGQPKKRGNDDIIFYLLAALLLMLGIIRTAYSRYFINMFRVFFNSSLRQSQLTDQLVQDKFPSLFLNALFVFTGGFYFYFVMQRQGLIAKEINPGFIGLAMAIIVIMYSTKFFTLKFIGWVTGYQKEADSYIFIIFLINKIIGICLLPVIIILAYSDKQLVNVFTIISFIIIGLMLLMRFFRSYGLLQHRLRVSRFHFLLYIFSLELLPLLLIYKAISSFVIKYL